MWPSYFNFFSSWTLFLLFFFPTFFNNTQTGLTCSIMVSSAQTPGREDEVARIQRGGGWVKEDRELYLSRLHDMDLQEKRVNDIL